jgi:tetratricopeptide (TPR) repeat protein
VVTICTSQVCLEAAEAIGAGIEAWDVLDLLTSLVEKSLVLYEERSQEPGYRLLETVRQYAWARLEERGEAASARARHRDWFLALAERAEPELRRSDQLVWLDRLEVEHDNLRAALEACRTAGAAAGETPEEWAEVRLAGALVWFWIQRSYLSEGRQQMEAALSRADDAPARLRIQALNGAARLIQLSFRDPAAAVQFHQACLDLSRASGDPAGVAMSLSGLALQSRMSEDGGQAVLWADEGVASARSAGDSWLIAFCTHVLGLVVRHQGESEGAISLFQESLSLLRPVGDRWCTSLVLVNLGGAYQARGDYESARRAYQGALVLAHELRDRRGMATYLECLAEVAVAEDRLDRGAQLMGAAEALLESAGASWPPPYMVSRERTQSALRAALGEAALTTAQSEGRALPMKEAVALAMEGAAV